MTNPDDATAASFGDPALPLHERDRLAAARVAARIAAIVDAAGPLPGGRWLEIWRAAIDAIDAADAARVTT